MSYLHVAGSVQLSADLEKVIAENDFRINYAKVRLQRYHNRQIVTGLLVNEKANVRRKFVRQIRAMLHDWEMTALPKATSRYYQIAKANEPSDKMVAMKHFVSVVQGKLAFLKMVRGEQDSLYLKYFGQFVALRSNAPV